MCLENIEFKSKVLKYLTCPTSPCFKFHNHHRVYSESISQVWLFFIQDTISREYRV